MFNSKKIESLEDDLRDIKQTIQDRHNETYSKMTSIMEFLKIGLRRGTYEEGRQWVAYSLPTPTKSKAKVELVTISSRGRVDFNEKCKKLLEEGFVPCSEMEISRDTKLIAPSLGVFSTTETFTQQFKRKLK